NRYVTGDKIAMDMRLLPYVYSADLVYEYATVPTATGSNAQGYVLKGYSADKADEYKAKDELLLLIPEFYSDGTHGQLPVIWIGDSAFDGFNVNSVTLPNGLLGIGEEAFGNTKLTKISLPASVYYLGDNAFSGSTSLAEVMFASNISNVGATIFSGTAYEATMPRNEEGFIFFDSQRAIIYGYEGTATAVTLPSSARTVGGGAFKGNATIKKLTISDGIRYVSDYAFENSVIESVTVGKFFSGMGVGIFKNCTKLVSVNFTSQYNLATIGVSMFEGCTALTTVNVSELSNLTSVSNRAFFGCSSLQYVSFGDNFLEIDESVFENCSSLISAEFGSSDASKFTKIGNRAFAGCTSLKRMILRGDLINNTIVSFGVDVFENAGYTKNGSFVTPVIYVKDKTVDNWRDDEDKIYSYVDIYLMRLPVAYRNMTVKPIDSKNPDVTVSGVVEISASAQFDLLAYLKAQGAYTVTDDVSYAADCIVYIAEVKYQNGQPITSAEGKYNLSAKGAYTVLLVAEDEFGNKGEAVLHLVVA
ncbi:MAG: leucine-rich repeat domain-containing protein, partial [Clostridia bacterium]|nr:leucine-rich repeat domain-containing protein [Clostridia bacterium]